jgi:hypothetical protein
MQVTQTLPINYREAGKFDLRDNRRLMVGLNLVGLVLMLFFGFMFLVLMVRLRPGLAQTMVWLEVRSLTVFVRLLVSILLLSIGFVVLHEAVHGFFFWLYTRSRPLFAFHWTYAYAAAPDWFMPRNRFLVVALAPLLIITAAGLLMMLLVPVDWLLAIWFVLTMNAAGAVGDLYIALRLAVSPESTLIQDRGDAITWYVERT